MEVEIKRLIKGGGNKMIKTVIRMKNDLVMVFDVKGEQMPAYQGPYEKVKDVILKDATPGAVFIHWCGNEAVPETITREEW